MQFQRQCEFHRNLLGLAFILRRRPDHSALGGLELLTQEKRHVTLSEFPRVEIYRICSSLLIEWAALLGIYSGPVFGWRSCMTPTLRAFPGVFLFLCLACVSPATAQTTFGSITGAVTDQTGSVIPGARVTVINEGNGAERRAETTNAGVFNVPNLNVGAYRVQIEAQGFRGYEQVGLALNANQ